MTVQINGSGSISGINVGGLPDGIVDSDMIANATIATADLADGAVTAVKSSGIGKVKDQFFSPCDGSVIALSDGNHTLDNVTGVQTDTYSYVDVNGSHFTYTPPAGTTQVIYEYTFCWATVDAMPIAHFRLYLDGTEVTYSRFTLSTQSYPDDLVTFKWGFNIGGTANADTGRLASWNSAKEIKLQWREYGSGDEAKLNQTYYFDGTTDYHFHCPRIGITAIG